MKRFIALLAITIFSAGMANAAIVQTIRTNTGTVNFPNSVTVLCASGEIVTGGGFSTNSQLGSAMKSQPVTSGSLQGWSIQQDVNNVQMTVYGICIKEA